MKRYADRLREYLDQNPIKYAEGESLLEQLYWCYGEANTLDISEIKAQYQKLRCCIPEVSEDRFDEIFDIISTLLVLQEKTAFQIGAKIGMRLAAELLKND